MSASEPNEAEQIRHNIDEARPITPTNIRNLLQNIRASREATYKPPYDPDVSYEDVVRNPQEAAALLRKLHKNSDPNRIKLAENLADCMVSETISLGQELTEQEWGAYLNSGLVDTIMDIVLDFTEYKKSLHDPYLNSYLTNVLDILHACMDRCAYPPDKKRVETPYSKRILRDMPVLWRFLWGGRSEWLTEIPPHLSEPRIPPNLVIDLVCTWNEMYSILHDKPASTNGYPGHLVLYSWAMLDVYGENLVNFDALNTLDAILSYDPLNAPTLISETFDTEVAADRFLGKLDFDLNDEFVVDDNLLLLFRVFHATLEHNIMCRKVILQEEWVATLLEDIWKAWRRQLCLGEDNALYPVLVGFMLICEFVMPDIDSCREDVITYRDKMELIYLISIILPYAIKEGPPSAIAHSCELLDLFVKLSKRPVAQKSPEAKTALKGVVQRVWLPTLKTIRGLPSSTKKVQAIRKWTALGHAVGLDEKAEQASACIPSMSSEWKHCDWKQCPCHTRVVPHKIRMCKGCYQVVYCGSKCQRLDWESGHRERCSRRR
ncbi:hypothetical protein K474DRAFT_1657017 [Panus rudis PR-1116 ss-1]|nr:hypothetical protein K474DRAFT_1657017 [Panus rudis PR-1116 ss-1]